MNYVNGGVQAAAVVYKGYQEAANYETAAKQYEQNAQTARIQGNAEEDRVRYDNALKMGEQRAAIAESGFSGSSASFDTLQQQSAGQLELNALTTRYKANLEALDWENRRNAANQAARTARHNANINKIATFIGATSGGGSTTGGPSNGNDGSQSGYAWSQAQSSDTQKNLYSNDSYGGWDSSSWQYNGYGG